jgi:hypothetical protein
VPIGTGTKLMIYVLSKVDPNTLNTQQDKTTIPVKALPKKSGKRRVFLFVDQKQMILEKRYRHGKGCDETGGFETRLGSSSSVYNS